MQKYEQPPENSVPECHRHCTLWSSASAGKGKCRVIDALLPEDEEWMAILEKEDADEK